MRIAKEELLNKIKKVIGRLKKTFNLKWLKSLPVSGVQVTK